MAERMVTGVDTRSQKDDLGSNVRARLRLALRTALQARDMTTASALRSALGAIGNAEAIHPGPATAAEASSPYFAGTVAGLGAGEAERHELSDADAEEIVRAEVAERQIAASEYDQGGRADQARRLRREAHVLISAMTGRPG